MVIFCVDPNTASVDVTIWATLYIKQPLYMMVIFCVDADKASVEVTIWATLCIMDNLYKI